MVNISRCVFSSVGKYWQKVWDPLRSWNLALSDCCVK